MYILVTVADVVQIPPNDFSKASTRAIEDWINNKYADKVVHKVGLVIGLHSIITTSEGLIGHGTGIVNVNVDFRLIVFRPFKGEILRGTITGSQMQEGITLSMDFFEDITVPPSLLYDGTTFGTEDGEELFVWHADDGEGGVNDYYFDQAEKCLWRAENEEWYDLSPQQQKPPEMMDEAEQAEGRKVPYRIVGSMLHSGLGPTLWWLGEEDVAAEQEDDGVEVEGAEVNGS
ncbi:DNA-directed RNA polymerase III polypeptide [Polychaeton citri CBS 116435]|uniref:DNA-directed RNA polymerase subunit n=1 Tax=Polychaeton citri CBS 116435 TaxID=1314669 RepID=A0A9P4QHF4_9PEZI|nr:DNA-directed RNA polymerase III polypeptide [Polychaeton citri CBS 116435]